MPHPIVIIGAGLAGYQLAREFRRVDQTSELIIITADAGKFYSKPLLSTALTSGKTAENLVISSVETMAEQLNATIHSHTKATRIDPENKLIWTGDESIPYSKVVLACGADVIKPPLEGDAVAEVLSINHLYHYAMFEDLIKNKKKIAILGAGLIGCEFANDLSNAGYEVDVIAPAKAPLDLLIPVEIGKLLQGALSQHNVRWHLQCVANKVLKTPHGYQLHLSNGNRIDTEFVLSAIGLIPHIELAETAKLKTQRGIVVNRYLETSANDIYALGDCAEVEGHVLPFITPLLTCARALAKTLSGERTAVDYPAMPVTVKTHIYPLVICPPPKHTEGEWRIESDNNNVRALFYNQQQELCGFVLTNDAVKERMALTKQLPALF